MWCWLFVCRIIVHDRNDVLSTGIDRSMWAPKVSMFIWCWTDSMGKIIISPRSGL